MNQDTNWYRTYDKSYQIRNRRDNYYQNPNSSTAQWQRSFSSQSFRNNYGAGRYRGSRSSAPSHSNYYQRYAHPGSTPSVPPTPWPRILPANSPPGAECQQEQPSTSQAPVRVSMTEVLEEGVKRTTLVENSGDPATSQAPVRVSMTEVLEEGIRNTLVESSGNTSTSQAPVRVSMTEVLEEGIVRTTLVESSGNEPSESAAEVVLVEPKSEDDVVTVKVEEDVKPLLPCVDLSEDDPETRLNKFHFETRTLYLQPLIGNTDECHFIEVLRKFKVVLSTEKGEIKSLSSFVKLLSRYMLFFLSNYKRVGGGYEEEYLEVMEDVMVQYCDIVAMLIRFQVQQKKKRQTKRLASRVKSLLSRCLLFRVTSIMHCLFKIKLETLENELRIFWTDIFIHFLNKVKYEMQDDDRYRAYIAYQLFKTIRAKDEEKTIDNAMYGRLGCLRSLKSISFLKDAIELKQNPRYVERDLLDRYWSWWKEERDFCSSLQQPSTIQIPGDTNREFTTLRRPVVATTQLDEVARLMQDRKNGKTPGLFQASEKQDPLSESVLFDSRLSFSGFDDSDHETFNDDDVVEMTVLPKVVETVELTDSDDDDLIVIEPEKPAEQQPEPLTTQPVEQQPEPLTTQPVEPQPEPLTTQPVEPQPEPLTTQPVEQQPEPPIAKPDIFNQLVEPEIPETPMEVSVENQPEPAEPEPEENLPEMNFLEFYDPDLEGFEENFDLLDDNNMDVVPSQEDDGKNRYVSIFDRPNFDEGSSDKPFDFDGSDEEADKEMEVPQPPSPSTEQTSVPEPEPQQSEPTVEIPIVTDIPKESTSSIKEEVPTNETVTVKPEKVVEKPIQTELVVEEVQIETEVAEACVDLPEPSKEVEELVEVPLEVPESTEKTAEEAPQIEEPKTTKESDNETKLAQETVEKVEPIPKFVVNLAQVADIQKEQTETPSKKAAKNRRKSRKERKHKHKLKETAKALPTADELYLDLWEPEAKEKKKKKKPHREGSRRSKRHARKGVIDDIESVPISSDKGEEQPSLTAEDEVCDANDETVGGSSPDNSPAYKDLDVSDVRQFFYEKGIVAEYVDSFSKTLSPNDETMDVQQTDLPALSGDEQQAVTIATPPDFLLEHQQLVGSNGLMTYATVVEKLDISGSQPCTPENSPSTATNVAYSMNATNVMYPVIKELPQSQPAELSPPGLEFVAQNNNVNHPPVKKHSVRFIETDNVTKRRKRPISDEETHSSAKQLRLQAPLYHVPAEEDLLSLDGPVGKPLRHPHELYWDNLSSVKEKSSSSKPKTNLEFCKKENSTQQLSALDWTNELYIKLKNSDLVSIAIVQRYQQERMRKKEAEAEAEASRFEKEKLAVQERAWQRAKLMEKHEKEYKQGNQIFLCLFNDKEHRRVSFKVDEEPKHKNHRNGHMVTDNRKTSTADTPTKTTRFSLPPTEKSTRFSGGMNVTKKKVSFENGIITNGSATPENGKLPRLTPSGRGKEYLNTAKRRPGRSRTNID